MDALEPERSSAPHASSRTLGRLPAGIWALGLVSLFMDISSELIHALLPILMTTVLGASMVTVGVIEGIAEATAAIVKVFSGAISDAVGRRKLLVLFGYGLGALSKPIFPLAATIEWVFAARFIDRIGKGIRGAPRDALIADIAQPAQRGAAYGLRQALDSVGAFLGPLLAMLLLLWFSSDIDRVLWIAVIPALVAVAILLVAVKEPAVAGGATPGPRLTLGDIALLPGRFWLVVTLGAVFTLARFSEAFLILRAQDVGLPIAFAPAIMIVMNLFYALFAYPAGQAADHRSPQRLLAWGLGVLVLADIALALATTPAVAFIGAGLWGLHMAMTQGLLAKLVADSAPSRLRGTAFGLFNLVSGVALLLASTLAGLLWSWLGATATFTAGAGFALLALAGAGLYRSNNPAE